MGAESLKPRLAGPAPHLHRCQVPILLPQHGGTRKHNKFACKNVLHTQWAKLLVTEVGCKEAAVLINYRGQMSGNMRMLIIAGSPKLV